MPRPCHSSHQPSPDTCRLCKLVETREDYRRLWGESGPHFRPGCKNLLGFSESRNCISCNKVSRKDHLYRCAKHDLCSLTRPYADAPNCLSCDDYSPVDPVEFYPGILDPIPDPELSPRPKGWATDPLTRDRHVWALRELLKQDARTPPHKSGTGVVICGGGKYESMIRASLQMLQNRVYGLPIQIWHRGQAEPLGSIPELARAVNGETYPHRILRGWESKTHALLHCPYETVLFLDADCYPVGDVRPLIELAKLTGFAAWGDMVYNHEFVGWDWFGVDPKVGQAVPSVQGGQFAIHFPKFSKTFMLAHWMNQHSEYFYWHPNDRPHEWHAYGDQDCWRAALALTQANWAFLGPARWEHPAFVCELGGEPMFVHRCRGKAFADKYEVTSHLPGDGEFWRYFSEGLESK